MVHAPNGTGAKWYTSQKLHAFLRQVSLLWQHRMSELIVTNDSDTWRTNACFFSITQKPCTMKNKEIGLCYNRFGLCFSKLKDGEDDPPPPGPRHQIMHSH
jgi:hypothetical protein